MATQPNRRGLTAETVSRNVKRARLSQNLGLRKLAEMTRDAGWPLSHNTIDKIELGTRRVDVDDLIGLAVALGTSPADLLTPHPSDWTPHPEWGDPDRVAERGERMPLSAKRPEVMGRWIRQYPLDHDAIRREAEASGGYHVYKRRRLTEAVARHPEVIGLILEFQSLNEIRDAVADIDLEMSDAVAEIDPNIGDAEIGEPRGND